jgi:hypothetical protein
MKEIWKDIVGYEGRYQISNIGRVRRLAYAYIDTIGRYRYKPECIVMCSPNKFGYIMVDLRVNHSRKRVYVHRLVAQAFIPNPNNLPQINHKDENKANNYVDNLEWCTHAYNQRYGLKNQRMVETRRKNGTYLSESISLETRLKISKALKGKKKVRKDVK